MILRKLFLEDDKLYNVFILKWRSFETIADFSKSVGAYGYFLTNKAKFKLSVNLNFINEAVLNWRSIFFILSFLSHFH